MLNRTLQRRLEYKQHLYARAALGKWVESQKKQGVTYVSLIKQLGVTRDILYNYRFHYKRSLLNPARYSFKLILETRNAAQS